MPTPPLRYALPLAKGSVANLHDGDKVQAEVVAGSHGEYMARVIKLYGRGDSARVCAAGHHRRKQESAACSRRT